MRPKERTCHLVWVIITMCLWLDLFTFCSAGQHYVFMTSRWIPYWLTKCNGQLQLRDGSMSTMALRFGYFYLLWRKSTRHSLEKILCPLWLICGDLFWFLPACCRHCMRGETSTTISGILSIYDGVPSMSILKWMTTHLYKVSWLYITFIWWLSAILQ